MLQNLYQQSSVHYNLEVVHATNMNPCHKIPAAPQ